MKCPPTAVTTPVNAAIVTDNFDVHFCSLFMLLCALFEFESSQVVVEALIE